MKYKIFIGGRFKYGTIVESDYEPTASRIAFDNFLDSHPDMEIDDVRIDVEEVEESEDD